MTVPENLGTPNSLPPQIQYASISMVFPSEQHPEYKALDNINLSIEKSEFFTLLGPSGCGKTTLLRMLAGFIDPTSGSVLLDGRNLIGTPPNKRPVNTVFQNYALFPHMTVNENISFGLKMLGWSSKDISMRIEEVISLVRLEGFGERKPSQLSGGQQQRVALARALAPKPKVLLLDEPLSALDLKLRKEMQVEMTRIRKGTETTFLFVTHDQEEALTMSDRIAVMSAGRVQQIGTPDQIYYKPATRFVADFIGEMNFLTANVGPGGGMSVGGIEVIPDEADRSKTAPQSSVTLAIRPEFCRISSSEKPEKNRIFGHVRQRVFSGPHTTLLIDLPDGSIMKARLDAEHSLTDTHNNGSAIAIDLPSHNLLVVKS